MNETGIYLATLHRQIRSRFTIAEITQLYAACSLNDAPVQSLVKEARVRYLISSLATQNRLKLLLTHLRRSRPRSTWHDIPPTFELPEFLLNEDIALVAEYGVYDIDLQSDFTFELEEIFVEESHSEDWSDNAVAEELAESIGDWDTLPEMSAIEDIGTGSMIGGDLVLEALEPKGPLEGSEEGWAGEAAPEFVEIAFETVEEETAESQPPLVQARRLEAAMPPQGHVGETTEVLVMIPRAESAGLAGILPVQTQAGEEINVDDVVGREAEIEFEAPDVPVAVYVAIETSSHDFEIEGWLRKIMLFADRDTEFESFYMTPKRDGKRVPVTVSLYRDEARAYVLGRVRLETHVLQESEPLTVPASGTLPFGTAPITINVVGGDQISANIEGSTGVSLGREASATVTSATVTNNNLQGAAAPGSVLIVALQAMVSQLAPNLMAKVDQFKAQIQLGVSAEDGIIAGLISDIVAGVPTTGPLIKALSAGLMAVAGPITQFTLGRLG